jgi:hypothetical protein
VTRCGATSITPTARRRLPPRSLQRPLADYGERRRVDPLISPSFQRWLADYGERRQVPSPSARSGRQIPGYTRSVDCREAPTQR